MQFYPKTNKKIETFPIHCFMFEVPIYCGEPFLVEMYVEYEIYKKNLSQTKYTLWAKTKNDNYRGHIIDGVVDVNFSDVNIIEEILTDIQKHEDLSYNIGEFLTAFDD